MRGNEAYMNAKKELKTKKTLEINLHRLLPHLTFLVLLHLQVENSA